MTDMASRPAAWESSPDRREDPEGEPIVRNRSGARLIAVGVVVVAVATMVATARSTPVVHGNKVLVIGDSIMNQSRPSVQDALQAEGWNPDIHAVGGTAAENWEIGAAELAAADHPNVVVVELGTNTCFSCSDFAGNVDQLMESFRDADLVVWLNVQEDATYPSSPRAVNYVLESTLVRWPNAEILDFSSRFAHHPEWHSDVLRVHLNSTGQQELARFIAAKLGPAPRG